MPSANNSTHLYQTESAVLFVIFKRPETTKLVLEQIRIARPKKLYIAADGPRPGLNDEKLLCEQTREVVSKIDWECTVKTKFNETNEGCKQGVSAAINWFFNNEPEGIILEDDCLPANSFFKFCDTLLAKYRYDTRVRHITGCNLQFGKKWGDGSYYFSNRTHVWGWASWKRAWDDYDINLSNYDSIQITPVFTNIYHDDLVAEAWANIFQQVKAGTVNSWAYPLDFVNFFNNGLVIIPNQNLISNIGFDSKATNTLDKGSVYANIPLEEMNEICHPVFIVPQKQADLYIINQDFDIDKKRRKRNSVKQTIKRFIDTCKIFIQQ
jgi:hypothetical protein